MGINPNHPLACAARANDTKAEQTDLVTVLSDLGLDLQEVTYMAEQRALRSVVLLTRGEKALAVMQMFNVVALTPEEQEMVKMSTLACLDGIVIGWSGQKLASS